MGSPTDIADAARDDALEALADAAEMSDVKQHAAEHVGLRFKDPEEKILGRDSHRLAKSVYGELSPSDIE